MPPLRALVASTNDTLRTHVAAVLARNGADVVAQTRSAEGVVVRAARGDVDVAVLDEKIPGIGGIQVADVIAELDSAVAAVVLRHGRAGEAVPPWLDVTSPGWERELLFATGLRGRGDPIRVFVVDDHETSQRGVQCLARKQDEIELVGEALTAATALLRLAVIPADVVLFELRLPDLDGVELCRLIHRSFPEVRSLVYTAYSDDAGIALAILAGASGSVATRSSADDLLRALRVVAAGGRFSVPGAPPRSNGEREWEPDR